MHLINESEKGTVRGGPADGQAADEREEEEGGDHEAVNDTCMSQCEI